MRALVLTLVLVGCAPDGATPELSAETLPPPGALHLAVSPAIVGQQVTFDLTGADPLEAISVVYSLQQPATGPCPPFLGGQCFGVRSPRVLFEVDADAAGDASVSFDVPDRVGQGVCFQAVVVRRPTTDTELSDVVCLRIQGDADGDGVGDDDDVCPGVDDASDGDGDGVACGADCNDGDPAIGPHVAEVCADRIDNDCDPATPDVFDADADGFTCRRDCDDGDPAINPLAVELCGDGVDNDCDPGTVDLFDGDGDGAACDVDCDDADARVLPGAFELPCDGLDNDCDAATADVVDADADGETCATDCDDANPAISSTATEACNGVDDDCDGRVDPVDASGCTPYYLDADADGFGFGAPVCQCAATSTFPVTNGADCFDGNGAAFPGQTEFFAGQRGDGSFDWDCDGVEAQRWTSSGGCSGLLWVCTVDAGWQGSTPACGATASWVDSCDATFLCDAENTSPRTQECR